MQNNKIWTIIKHEYLLKVRSKGFIISTILSPLLIALLLLVPVAIAYFTATSDIENAVILINDKTELIADKIIALNTNNQKTENSVQYKKTADSEEALKAKIIAGEISAVLLLSDSAIIQGKAKIITGASTGLKFVDNLRSAVNDEIKNLQLYNAGIDQQTINLVNSSVDFESIKVTEKGEVQDDSEIKMILSYFLGFAMYMLMFIYGGQVMQGVIEEKANRIVEVLASSASPFEIMFGKVVGIGAVGLTQVLLWLILGGGMMILIGNFLSSPEAMTDMLASTNMNMGTGTTNDMSEIMKIAQIPDISIYQILAFIFYFLTGYFTFATLFAAVGSTVDQPTDANSLTAPLSILIIIPILLISNIVMNPEGTVAIVASLFPFFAPILMVARIISISVPFWQIILSIVLQIATFLICLKIAAKIYKIGMLRYGKKVGFKDLFHWIVQK